MNRCHYCDVAKPSTDLRPYGPAGELVCFPCATAPERKATTKGRMTAALAAAEEASVAGAAILKPGGFSPGRPYLPPPPVLAAARMAVRKFTSTLVDEVAHAANLAAWSATMTRIAREVIEPAFGPVDLAVTLEVDSEGRATEVFAWGPGNAVPVADRVGGDPLRWVFGGRR